MHDGFNISFDDIHKIHSKCNTNQIMRYQIAINFHRVLNFENLPNSEQITILEQMVCGRRQLKFELIRLFNGKIGMNTTANKFYHISKLVGLDLLNLKFVHYKKVVKLQFLKYGKTWLPPTWIMNVVISKFYFMTVIYRQSLVKTPDIKTSK